MEGVWAIDENGKPTICKAKPENRGKKRCKHQFHQLPGESREEFFQKHWSEYVPEESIFDASEIQVSQYKMTEEEKELLPEIKTKKDLLKEYNDGAYLHVDEALWNDMDKNTFASISPYSVTEINDVLHEKSWVVLKDIGEHKTGDILTKEQAEHLKFVDEDSVGTSCTALNQISENKYNFEATKDIYVLPYYMRPSTPGDDGEAKPDDVSELYKHVFATRKYGGKNAQLAYEQLVNNHNLDENSRNKKAGGYAAQSLYDRFGGKGGVFRKNLTGYTIPYSGRAVIVPTTSINYDEVKIPAAMAADIFKPTIQSNLERKGFSRDQIREILADAKKPQAEVAPITRNILQAAMEEENVRTLLIRQPTLHKASMQGFKPKISENATVQINPIIVGGYNADFDGDTMQVIAINTSDLTPTIDKTMHPSNFKYTPRAQEELNMKPTKDAKWGIMNVLKRRS